MAVTYELANIVELTRKGYIYGYSTASEPNYIYRLFCDDKGEVAIMGKGRKTSGFVASESVYAKLGRATKLHYINEYDNPRHVRATINTCIQLAVARPLNLAILDTMREYLPNSIDGIPNDSLNTLVGYLRGNFKYSKTSSEISTINRIFTNREIEVIFRHYDDENPKAFHEGDIIVQCKKVSQGNGFNCLVKKDSKTYYLLSPKLCIQI